MKKTRNVGTLVGKFYQEDTARRKGRASKFVKTKTFKLDAHRFLIGMTLGRLMSHNNSLSTISEGAGVEISRSGMHQRFNERAVGFMRMCFEWLLAQVEQEKFGFDVKLLRQFRRVLVWDSSKWQVNSRLKTEFRGSGGSGKAAECKLQFCFDFRKSQIVYAEVGNGATPDQSARTKIVECVKHGDLLLADLGYFCIPLLKAVKEKGAFFVSRLLSSCDLRLVEGEQICSVDLLRFLSKNDRLLDREIGLGKVRGNECPLTCRLIAVRLSAKERNKRLRQLKQSARKRGVALSKRSRMLASWSLFVTNVSAELLPAEKVYDLYRVRWSVELLFRQLKSTLRVHRCSHGNRHRLLCEVYGTMIIALLSLYTHAGLQWLHKAEMSVEKVFKLLRNNAYRLLESINNNRLMPAWISLLKMAANSCRKAYQPSRMTTLQRLAMVTP